MGVKCNECSKGPCVEVSSGTAPCGFKGLVPKPRPQTVIVGRPREVFAYNRRCVKCGSHCATARWMRSTTVRAVGETLRDEYIFRVCQVCGYGWKESPLDSEGK